MLNIRIKSIYNFVIVILLMFFSVIGYGLTFNLIKDDDVLVGEVKTTQVKTLEEDFSDIGEKFDVGYYEMFEANPGVDPDNPPVGTVLVVPTQYILPVELKVNTIVINLAEMRLYYRTKDNKIYIFPVGIGKEDWATPTGEMTIVKKVKNPTWVVPQSIYKFRQSIGDKIKRVFPPGPDNPLGSYALRLSKGEFLIHGTNFSPGVGRRSSAGCIRLYERDIEQLYNLVDIGTRVIIMNQPYKAGWHGKKLYLEAHNPLFEQRMEMGNDVKPIFDVVSTAIKEHKILIDWTKVAKIAREHLTVPRVVN